MFFEDLNTYLVEMILNKLSVEGVMKVSKVFPQHFEAVNTYWAPKQEITIYKGLYKKTSDMVEHLQQCRNLRTVSVLEDYDTRQLTKLISTLVKCCPSLESLHIPKAHVTNSMLILLGKIATLKRIHFNIKRVRSIDLENIFINNPMLQDVYIEGNFPGTCFRKIPKTVQKLVLFNSLGKVYKDMLSVESSCQIELLHVNNIRLKIEQIMQLYKLENLVSVSLCSDWSVSDIDLIRLITKNTRLQEFSINAFAVDGSCLLALPKTLKLLKVRTVSYIREEFIIIYLEQGASNLESLSIVCDKFSGYTFSKLIELQQLKSLELINVLANQREAVFAIARHSLHLEELKLESRENLQMLWEPINLINVKTKILLTVIL